MSLQDTSSSFSSQSISDKELTHGSSVEPPLAESRDQSGEELCPRPGAGEQGEQAALHLASVAGAPQSLPGQAPAVCTSQQDEFTVISVPASTAQLTDLLAALETGEMEEVEDTLAARLLCIKTAWHQDCLASRLHKELLVKNIKLNPTLFQFKPIYKNVELI